jgi:uncharacterized protein YkwD
MLDALSMPSLHFSPRRLAAAALLAATLPLAAPAAGLAHARPRHSDPVAHVALGVMDSGVKRFARRATVRRARPAKGHAAAATASRAACAGADTPATGVSPAAVRASVICLVNHERTSRGLPALRDSSRLDRSAQGWTDTLAATGQFTHGADFSARISAVGYDWQSAGENIATGFATPSAVVGAWMASPGHCRNILSPSFADIGVGVRPTAGGAGATWTQDFGLWMGATVPSHDTAPMNSCATE